MPLVHSIGTTKQIVRDSVRLVNVSSEQWREQKKKSSSSRKGARGNCFPWTHSENRACTTTVHSSLLFFFFFPFRAYSDPFRRARGIVKDECCATARAVGGHDIGHDRPDRGSGGGRVWRFGRQRRSYLVERLLAGSVVAV